MKLGEKKNEIRIVKETDAKYTFVDTTPLNLKQEWKPNSSIKTISNTQKDLHTTRSINSRKSKIYKKELDVFNKYLSIWVAICIICGTLIGY